MTRRDFFARGGPRGPEDAVKSARPGPELSVTQRFFRETQAVWF